MSRNNWDNLLIEDKLCRRQLPDESFRRWLSARRVRIQRQANDNSDVLSEALSRHLRNAGATTVVSGEFEAPYLRPAHALQILSSYPDEVILVPPVETLGKDSSGFSELAEQVDVELRAIAVQGEQDWIKLDNLIFPGHVTVQFADPCGYSTFTVMTDLANEAVCQALTTKLNRSRDTTGTGASRLTWSSGSYPVEIVAGLVETRKHSRKAVNIICRLPSDYYGESGDPLAMMTLNNGPERQPVYPADLAVIWARQAFLGENCDAVLANNSMVCAVTAPATKTLPQVLAEVGADEQTKRILAQLHLVEEVKLRYGSSLKRLYVGALNDGDIWMDTTFPLRSRMAAQEKVVSVQGCVRYQKTKSVSGPE